MFCPNCGKEIKETDNFCRYCGSDLRAEIQQPKIVEVIKEEIPVKSDEEEYVLYDVQKHHMALVLPIFLIPLFFIYFWNIFLNTHSFFSWIVVFAIVGMIIYPIARYKSDSIVITNKFAHIKIGVLNPEEIDIPLEKLDILEVSQTSLGRIFNYGQVSFCTNSEKFDFGYIKNPEDLQYIIDNPKKFVDENL